MQYGLLDLGDQKLMRMALTNPSSGAMACPNFAKQVAEIKAGVRDPIMFVDDLKPSRDDSDVCDIVRGYRMLLERGEPAEVYNLCSGCSWVIQQVLDVFRAQSPRKDIALETDATRLRPSDVMILEGDASKIRKASSWEVEIPFERTLEGLLNYWRQWIA